MGTEGLERGGAKAPPHPGQHELIGEFHMTLIVTVELSNNVAVELTGANCKVWLGYGLPDYEGPIDGLAEALPDVLRELQAGGFIKSV